MSLHMLIHRSCASGGAGVKTDTTGRHSQTLAGLLVVNKMAPSSQLQEAQQGEGVSRVRGRCTAWCRQVGKAGAGRTVSGSSLLVG